jgi:cytidine deaminase
MTRAVSSGVCAAPEWMLWCGCERAGSFRRVNVISHDALIASAEAGLNPHTVDGHMLGDVASTLVTEAGTLFSRVCIDTGSGTGFCAEHAAIAAMVTARE